MNKPKILVFDIETAPNLGYTWGLYEQNVVSFKHEWYVLSFVAKWLGEKKIITSCLFDFKTRFKKDPTDDYAVIKKLWNLFDEADVVIAHNGDKFDIRKMNARFIYHNLTPPSPYKSIDTLKIARKYFKFNSNKLDDLGKHLGLGEKVKHEGFGLWLKCMNGNKKAWKKMTKYNIQDVLLLEKIYYKFRPWIIGHPNYGTYLRKDFVCPNCGSTHVHKRGTYTTTTRVYQRFKCQECGAWSRSVKSEKELTKPGLTN